MAKMNKSKQSERKNLKAMIIYVLLCAIALTGVTFSKYISIASGGDEARVAKFEITDLSESFSDAFTVTMNPGVEKQYSLEIQNNSEVEVRLKTVMETDGNLPLVFFYSADGGVTKQVMTSSGPNSVSFDAALDMDKTGNYYIYLNWDQSQASYEFSNGVAALRLVLTVEQID